MEAEQTNKPTEHSSWLTKCPVCKIHQLSQVDEIKFFGLLRIQYVECECGAAFWPRGDKYQLLEVTDKSLPAWQQYGNKELTPKEWANIAHGESPTTTLAMAFDVRNLQAEDWFDAYTLQRTYWTYNPDEKAALLARYPDSLSWSEILRLHHLTCLELLSSEECNAQLMGDLEGYVSAPKGAAHDLCRELAQRLLSQDSPYRVRHCDIWQGEAGQSGQRPPDFSGQLWNLSLTHLGCLEVIHLGSQNQPKELSFIPFDHIRGVLFAQPSLFRAAKVLYEDSSEEIVYVPLIYGVSWLTDIKYDHDGTMTRFCCHPRFEGLDMPIGLGIGIGHQDFIVTVPEGHMFGLGSIGEIMTGLELDDPTFEEKCRARNLDPDAVREQLESE